VTRLDIRRFTYAERTVHWVVGLSFLFLLLTGLAFSHPRLFWMTALAGGGSAARVLHPWIGVVFAASVVAMLALWARDMRIDERDRAWLRALRHYAVHDRAKVPPAGKYNGGQKMFFWCMSGLGAIYLLSGIPMWMPQGVLGLGPFYGATVNVMRLVHYLATVAGGLLLIVHVYLGTIAYPGTLGAMLHGRVTRAWAKLHHPAWRHEERPER
jgi:formate dehydrogenase subunit gamma